MIIAAEKRYREGDTPRKYGKLKRKHVLVKCDVCGNEKWMYEHTFKRCRTHSNNNDDKKDFCKECRIKRDVEIGWRVKRIQVINEAQVPSRPKPPRIRVRKDFYRQVWVSDLNHPRLNKNSRDKAHKGGRVYEHILVMEKHLGRYLTPQECIHHLDGDKGNNNIDNLCLCGDLRHHNEIHNKMERFMYQMLREGRVVFDKDTETFRLK